MTEARQAITASLQDVFGQVFDEDDIEITDDMTAADVEEWDSLSHITLVVAVERRFGIKFRASELEGLKNVGEMIDVIAAKTGAGSPA